jgi:hypothetical protein
VRRTLRRVSVAEVGRPEFAMADSARRSDGPRVGCGGEPVFRARGTAGAAKVEVASAA